MMTLFLFGSLDGGRESMAEISLPRKIFVIKCSAPVFTEPVCHMTPTLLRNGNTTLEKVSSKPLFMIDLKRISLTELPLKESIATINELIFVSELTESLVRNSTFSSSSDSEYLAIFDIFIPL